MKKQILVCVTCGHEVSGKCGCAFSKFEGGGKAFCGNCGEFGSHQPFTTATKWKKYRKLMGLPSKINSYD